MSGTASLRLLCHESKIIHKIHANNTFVYTKIVQTTAFGWIIAPFPRWVSTRNQWTVDPSISAGYPAEKHANWLQMWKTNGVCGSEHDLHICTYVVFPSATFFFTGHPFPCVYLSIVNAHLRIESICIIIMHNAQYLYNRTQTVQHHSNLWDFLTCPYIYIYTHYLSSKTLTWLLVHWFTYQT